MRAMAGVRVAALLAATCFVFGCQGGDSPGGGASAGSGGAASGGGSGGKPATGGSGGTGGGTSGSGGSGLETGGASGSGGTSGVPTGGTSGAAGNGGGPGTGASPGSDAAADSTEAGGDSPTPAGDGTALMVVGPQVIGTDMDIMAALKARNLKVETVVDAMATPAHAEGKSLVVLSYSLDSDNFKADYSGVKAPIIVMEHALLAKLGMTAAADHKWAEPVTALTITSEGAGSPLAAGLPAGDHVVYSKTGEFFWGIPSAGAIKVATVKGSPTHWVIFAYPAGAMMVGKAAAGKRLQFFFGAHLVPDMYLNDTGKKLLGAAVDWCLK